MTDNAAPADRSRRTLLKTAALGGTAAAAGLALPATARASAPTTAVDTSHASPEVVRVLSAYFRDKSAADVEATMAHFAKRPVTYVDAVVGWPFSTWQELHDLFARYMPTWPAGARSYPTRIVGDATGAIVHFTDDAGLFGPSEIRAVGVVDLTRGRITRWVDYWDGRHFGISDRDALKVPDDRFPTDFKESTVGENAAARTRRVAAELNRAFAADDSAAASALFTPDASFTDLVSHVHVVGRRHIGSFLAGARGLLPYTGSGARVRHVVGSNTGGGYEWTASGAVPRGVNTLELDDAGRITSFTAMWDGAEVEDDRLLRLAAAAVER
ncbi:nuclear transport factor 2 family protein [Umezawaea tangerina]|uniref:SnoaL-like protein n=1 Tax=Umezawaea tangerina TaxID=84725 RepID=A0A2T0T474_9PSEU|nr:nuclear transport factor 2 family protein [Umezawaea tangerina]PRY40467.1 SnoaL-like protein [Umezawaea tangerina]